MISKVPRIDLSHTRQGQIQVLSCSQCFHVLHNLGQSRCHLLGGTKLSQTRDQTHFVFIFSLIHGAVDHPAGIHLSKIMLSGWLFQEDAAA